MVARSKTLGINCSNYIMVKEYQTTDTLRTLEVKSERYEILSNSNFGFEGGCPAHTSTNVSNGGNHIYSQRQGQIWEYSTNVNGTPSITTNLVANNLPSDVNFSGYELLFWGFDKSENVYYFFVKRNSDRYYFIWKYFIKTGVLTKFEDKSIYLNTQWDTYITWSNNAYNNTKNGMIFGSLLTDKDETKYFGINYMTPMGIGDAMIMKMISNGNSLSLSNTSRYMPQGFGERTMTFGYSSKWGYYVTGNGWDNQYSRLLCTKDPYGGGTEIPLSTFLSNNGTSGCYRYLIGLKSSSGLIAQVQETPIFLGGYYSILHAQSVNLYPNCTNYIYVLRDRVDRTKLNIFVSKTNYSLPGYTSFNKVLISKITTDAQNPISQEDFEISWK